ncbi:MAG: hypothetical protein HKO89_02785 [Saprospiraceae bacterium]|nr:hypothetical protein [Saprospiraceae bacterium]
MKHLKIIFFIFSVLASGQLFSQTTIDFNEENSGNLYIKLYGHVDYNHKIESGVRHAGKMDVHRLVTLFGYQFSRKTQFVSEIEVEHVKEIFIEQAFVKHRITRSINLKAGLLIVPMGFVNESHEPTFFYSVERPLLDKNIIPSTWREIGLGISGLLQNHNLKYQLYLVNNPNGFDGEAKINGAKGIRSARQKGAESIVTGLPGISGQLEYYGFENMRIGWSTYYGKTNTSLYDDFDVIDDFSTSVIDSSTVTMHMNTLHFEYTSNKLTARYQHTFSAFRHADRYNQFTGSDVPELMHGFYTLVAYNVLNVERQSLEPFFRYAHLNNHLNIPDGMDKKDELKQNIYTIGVNYKPDPGVVLKVDFQFYERGNGSSFQQFNTGIGVWF